MKKLLLTFLALLIANNCYAGWYNSSWENRKKITIDNTKVGANETDFPVLIKVTSTDLSSAQSDGDDILFTSSDGETKLDHEIEEWVMETGKLVAWVQADLSSSSDTEIYVYYNNSSASNQENINGTWTSDYLLVNHLKDYGHTTLEDSTSNNTDGTITAGADVDFYVDGNSGILSNAQQGIAYDGTYFYVIDTNYLTKYNSSWVSQATNTDPTGDTSISGLNHTGDGDVYDGNLYVPVEEYPNTPYDNQYICNYNTSDLSYNSCHDVSSEGVEVAGLTIDSSAGANGIIYVVSFVTNDRILKYDLSNYDYLGYISLSSNISQMQGITYDDDYFYISYGVSSSTIKTVKKDGTVLGDSIYFSSGTESEGVDYDSSNEYIYWNYRTSSGNSIATLKKTRVLSKTRNYYTSTQNTYFTQTMPNDGSITLYVYPWSFFDYGALWDNSVEANDWEAWIYADGRLAVRIDGTPMTYDLDNLSGEEAWYLIHYTWDNTGDSYLYINGVQRDTKSTDFVTPGTTLYLNGHSPSNDTGLNTYDEFRVSNTIKDSDYVLTEYNNLSSPSTFYSVGAEEENAVAGIRVYFGNATLGNGGVF